MPPCGDVFTCGDYGIHDLSCLNLIYLPAVSNFSLPLFLKILLFYRSLSSVLSSRVASCYGTAKSLPTTPRLDVVPYFFSQLFLSVLFSSPFPLVSVTILTY
ncbi:hypothetical protein ABW19_dt0206452 [Dactylella cylindrospora]|nr:hypothetical protein ABW19_dt0206452 [Dactylella cylindrospora]